MQVTNIQYYHNMPFEEYLNISGTSFSSLTGFSGPPTSGMRLGTRVHNYLNEPELYDWLDADLVLPIATSLRTYLGNAYYALDKEVAFTADFIHNGMMLKYKGRADMLRAGRLVVDIKILSGSLDSAIARFGYDKQISGYCFGSQSPAGLIIAYNKSRKRVEVKMIKPCAEFWQYQTVRMGTPVNVMI